jgi:glycosyltransferase involved in cell wall biosynthesis
MNMVGTPLKLVYITPALYMAGGVERVLTLKANYFAEHFGYDITIVLTEGKDSPLFYPLSDKIKVINLDINFEELWTCSFAKKIFVYLKKQRQYKRKLSAILMDIRPDITISLLRREINFINDIPDGSRKIGEIHINRANYRNFKSDNENCLKRLFAKYWSHSLLGHLRKLDSLVVLTDKDREAWTELNNVVTIPNPLPFTPTKSSLQTEKRVIAIARYSYEKGIDLLVQTWAEVERQCEDWRLDVFGDGDTSSYEHLIDNLGIDRNRCGLNARTNDVEREYCNSSIFALSSRFEGFGMVMIEAMACGLPVVAFNCPWGPQEIVNNGEDGILVDNGSPSSLANGLLQLINDVNTRKAMSEAAERNVLRFKIDYIAQKWQQLFEQVNNK